MTVLEDCMTEIKNAYDGITLTGLGSHPVVIRSTPWDERQCYEGLTIHFPIRESEQGGTNDSSDLVYPIHATLIRQHAGSEVENIAGVADFREKSWSTFHHQDVVRDAVADVVKTIVRWRRVLLPEKYRKNYTASTLAIVCYTRQRRP